MENYENLLEDIKKTIGRIADLYDVALVQYSHAVDEILADRLTDEKQIERILDGLINYGDDRRFLELSKTLCRYIYYHYPQLVGNFEYMPRLLFEGKDEGE